MKVTPARPPIAASRPKVLEAHGDRRVDPYYWLRDKQDPDVIAYLEAENAYTDAVLAGAGDLQDRLYREVVGRVQETDSSAATLYKGWWTYTRTVEGLDYEIYCRRRGSMDAPEEVILDANELAKGHDYFELGYVERSPDENLLAYAVDFNGSERHRLRFRDLRTGQDLVDTLEGVYYGAAWAADNKTFFYVMPDAATRPYQVWRHRLGTSNGDDELVFQEDDERFEVGVELSKSERYIFITSSSQVSSETLFLRSEAPAQTPILIEPRRDNIEYAVDDQEGRFLYLTNDGATNFRLMAAPTTSPSRPSWTEVVPERPSVRLNFTDVHQHHVVLGQRSDGLERLEVLDTESGRLHVVDQPDVAYTAFPGSNPDYDRLIDQSKKELDPAKRTQLFMQEQKVLYDDAVIIGLVARKGPFAYTAGIDGFAPSAWAGLPWNIEGTESAVTCEGANSPLVTTLASRENSMLWTSTHTRFAGCNSGAAWCKSSGQSPLFGR